MNNYDLELGEVITKIKETKAKTVCLQLPDGLKPKAREIEEKIAAGTKTRVLIWLGSNFGACDVPLGLEQLNIDLLISWGHTRFCRTEGWS